MASDDDFYWPSRKSHELIGAAFDRKRREEEEAEAEAERQRRQDKLAAAAAERQRLEERVADALEAIRDRLAETESERELDAPSRQGRELSRETKRKLMRRLRQRKKNPRDHSQRAIAEDLGISPTTVQRYWAKMSDS